MMGKKSMIIKWITRVVFLIIVAAMAIYIANDMGLIKNEKISDYTDNQTVDTEPEKKGIVQDSTEVDVEVVKEKIASIGELATAEYQYTSVASTEDAKTFFGSSVKIPFTTNMYVFSYDGKIKAGVDFSEITITKDSEKSEIIVTIPKAKFLSSELFDDSFKLYDEKNSVFNQISVSEVTASIKDLKADAEKKAKSEGLLDTAQSNAEVMISNIIDGALDLTDTDYHIEYVIT